MTGMSAVSPTPTLPAGLPEDWVQKRDVACPKCSYNLRMLHAPRCPECGLVFRWQQLLLVQCPRCNEDLYTIEGSHCPRCKLDLKWDALLDSASCQDRKLYEYSSRPARAALRTWVIALNPWGFWKRIPLESPPVVGRLRWLRRVAVGVCLLGLGLAAWLAWQSCGFYYLARQFSSFALALTLPLVTAIGLPRFTPTLVRFRIRRDQLLRCLAYASSGLFWIGMCFVLGFVFAVVVNILMPVRLWRGGTTNRVWFDLDELVELVCDPIYGGWGDPFSDWFNLLLGIVLVLFSSLWWWAFLYVSLRRYLRLDRANAWALLLSTQLIGMILLAIILLRSDVGMDAVGHLQLWLAEFLEALLDGGPPD